MGLAFFQEVAIITNLSSNSGGKNTLFFVLLPLIKKNLLTYEWKAYLPVADSTLPSCGFL